MYRQLLALFSTELTLLSRNKAAAGIAFVMPFALGAFLAFGSDIFGDGTKETPLQAWIVIIAVQLASVLGFTVYISTTSSFTARRQELYLKRLRCGEAGDGTIIAGIALPGLVLGVLQLAVILAMTLISGAPLPANPVLLLVALLGGAAMCSVLAIYTSTLTGTSESAQITTLPFFCALLGTAIWAGLPAGEPTLLQKITPGGALTELIRGAWNASASVSQQFVSAAPAMGALLGWASLAAFFAKRSFRWEPRS